MTFTILPKTEKHPYFSFLRTSKFYFKLSFLGAINTNFANST